MKRARRRDATAGTTMSRVTASILAMIVASSMGAASASSSMPRAAPSQISGQRGTACVWQDSVVAVAGRRTNIRVLQNISVQAGQGEVRSFQVDESGVRLSMQWRTINATTGAQYDPSGDQSTATGDASAIPFGDRPTTRSWIVGSTPVPVAAPAASPRDAPESAAYEAFSQAHRNRREMIYAITDDGIFRGYDAATGVQTTSFTPTPPTRAAVQPEDQPMGAHLAVSEAFFAGNWHSVAVGTTGSTVFALDVTSPTSLKSDARPGRPALLWELAGLRAPTAHSFTQPVIAKLRNGSWAAILGTSSAGNDPGSGGETALYLLDIANGELIRKFDIPEVGDSELGVPANAMASPAAVNALPGDAIEYVYAGDRRGRLWKFDLSASSPDSWHISFDGQPLFEARDSAERIQSIVTRPEVIRGSNGTHLLVLFGAGSPTGPPVSGATFYAVMDDAVEGPTRQSMRHLQIADQTDARTSDPAARMVTFDTKAAAANTRGWYLDLPIDAGEEFSSQPAVRSSQLVFSTQEPASACHSRRLWTFVLDTDGGTGPDSVRAPARSSEASSLVTTGSAVATQGQGALRLAPPAIVQGVDRRGQCALHIYPPAARAGSEPVIAQCDSRIQGRQSWRQLR